MTATTRMIDVNKCKIAILMTCHNRREITLQCLRSLYSQELPDSVTLRVFLTDDGSIDGTNDEVAKAFSDVMILCGNGSLYWCGGMRVAWEAALKSDNFDYFLWLNDDTFLKQGAITDMLIAAKAHFGIIVGSCHDPETGMWTYGGRTTSNGKKSLNGTPVLPGSTVQWCQQLNGNVVLVPKTVVDRIGILSESFTHAIGDYDYGFRALDAGIPLIVSPNYQATCKSNQLLAWCNPKTPLLKRLVLVNNPKGLDFCKYMVFCYRHFGMKCIYIGCKILLRIFFPTIWNYFKSKNVKA